MTDYSDEVLESTPERATRLLTGIGAVATIRTLLFQAGMTNGDIVEGRTLLLACLAQPQDAGPEKDTEGARAQRAATAELDEWDEPHFGRIAATLRRYHPGAADYVFRDLHPSTGSAAVAGVATLLQRVKALESGSDKDRAATKAEDKKAVDLLATRRFDKTERDRLEKLVETALGPTAPLDATPADQGAARREALTSLRGWFEEWSATARAVVKKKSHLIRLGLANRKSPAPKGSGDGGPAKPAG
jgi:hypothetical protein